MVDPPPGWPAMGRFNRRVRALLETPLTLTDDGGITSALLQFDPEAATEWRSFHDKIERQLRPGGPLSDIKDAASKVADNIARVAALLHVFEDSPTTSVTIESVRAAHRIVAWHIRESRRFLGSFSPPEALAKAVLLEDWMVAYCKSNGVTSLTTTNIGQNAPLAVRRKKEFDPILNTLSEHHRCRLDQDGLTRRITINPALVEGE